MTDFNEIHIPELVATAFGGSRSEARRKMAQGAVTFNGEMLDLEFLDITREELNGELRVGKRQSVDLVDGVPTTIGPK